MSASDPKVWTMYVVLCVVTDKLYFGGTTQSLHKRWGAHVSSSKRGSKVRLAEAISARLAQS